MGGERSMIDLAFKIRKVENGFVLIVIRNWGSEEYIFSNLNEMVERIKRIYGWRIE